MTQVVRLLPLSPDAPIASGLRSKTRFKLAIKIMSVGGVRSSVCLTDRSKRELIFIFIFYQRCYLWGYFQEIAPSHTSVPTCGAVSPKASGTLLLSPQLSTVQDGIYALRKAHMRFPLSKVSPTSPLK